MASQSKVCFVISPIGDDESDIRINADDLLELIIEPALEAFNFSIIRADKISSPSIITNDIVKLVQEAQLCVVDLTGHNPNVYYECGRRHETGKPTIQLIKKGEKIPFDVAGIRTISYDLSSARVIRDTINVVREFIKPFEGSGYVVSTSGASLTSIAASIERIERHISRIGQYTASSMFNLEPSEADDVPIFMKAPRTAIMDSLASGDFNRSEILLEKFKDRLTPTQLVEMSCYLANVGSKLGRDYLIEASEIIFSAADSMTTKIAVGSICQFYLVNDMADQGLQELEGFFNECLEKFKSKNDLVALIYWQMSRLHHGCGRLKLAYNLAEKANDLDLETYKELFLRLQKPLDD